MCRGYQPNKRERLFIKGFYLRLSFSFGWKVLLPSSLTLHLLPRINGGFLEIDGSSVRPDAPGLITMHRIVSAEKKLMTNRHGVVYGSGENLKASEGSRFEVYMGDVKLFKGFITKDESEKWELECKCSLEEDELDFVREIDICVAVEGQNRPMYKKVELTRRKAKCFKRLEDIPEETERESGEGEEKESQCWCDECSCGDDSDSATVTVAGDCDMDVETREGVTWAVDVGIWVMCLGFGYFVTRASYRRLRHARLL